jgi:hypothetical protein
MSLSAPSIDTVSRDPSELEKLGKFRLRSLAEKLGLLTSDDEKARFMTLGMTEIAQAVAQALRARDGSTALSSTEPRKTFSILRTPVNGQRPNVTGAAAAARAATTGKPDLAMFQKAVDQNGCLALVAIALGLMVAEHLLGKSRRELLQMALAADSLGPEIERALSEIPAASGS